MFNGRNFCRHRQAGRLKLYRQKKMPFCLFFIAGAINGYYSHINFVRNPNTEDDWRSDHGSDRALCCIAIGHWMLKQTVDATPFLARQQHKYWRHRGALAGHISYELLDRVSPVDDHIRYDGERADQLNIATRNSKTIIRTRELFLNSAAGLTIGSRNTKQRISTCPY